MHSDANAKNTSVTGAPSLQAPVTPSFDFWVTPLILPPPAEHPVAHTLDAAPRPAFNYDSIDVFKTVICALSVEGTEEQSFEDYEAMYEQNLMSPDLLSGTHDKHKTVRPEHDFDLNSVSEHNGDPVMGTELVFENATFETIPNPFFLMLWATLSFFNISISYAAVKSCLSYELFTHAMVTLIFGLFFTIGQLSNFGFVFLTLMTVVLTAQTFKLIRTLWTDVRRVLSSTQPQKRVRLTPRPSRVQQWVIDPYFKNIRTEEKGVSQFKRNLMPNINVHCVRPDGPAATNKDTRQLIVSPLNKVKMTEAKVKFIDSRPYLNRYIVVWIS